MGIILWLVIGGVIGWLANRREVSFEIEEGLVGGAAIDATGTPCPDATVEAAHRAFATLGHLE